MATVPAKEEYGWLQRGRVRVATVPAKEEYGWLQCQLRKSTGGYGAS